MVAATTVTATIPVGQALSNSAAFLNGVVISRLRMPGAWTGGIRNVITFQTSVDNVDFMDLYDLDGKEVQVVMTPNSAMMLGNLGITSGKFDTYLKVRAGTSKLPIIQDADRVFTFVAG